MASTPSHKKKKTSNDPSFRKKRPLDYFPVQRKVNLGSAAETGATSGQFDTGRILSQLNHRLYRYGKRYTQKIDVDPSGLNPGTTVDVWALMDTWFVQKAFEEAKVNFDRAYEIERDNISKSQMARWRDFRVQSGITADALYPVVDGNPTSAPLTVITAGEFNDSIVEDAAGATRTFTWAATVAGVSYGLMSEYTLAANTTTTPTTPTGAGPYDDLSADASAVEMQALQDRGNLPPYNAATLPSVWVKIATLTVGAGGNQKISTGFFDAPCGLVCINVTGQTLFETRNSISLTVQSGDYKGVRAHNQERM